LSARRVLPYERGRAEKAMGSKGKTCPYPMAKQLRKASCILFLIFSLPLFCINSASIAEELGRFIIPEFRIKEVNISGRWKFCLDPGNVGEREGWYRAEYDDRDWDVIEVPGMWEEAGYVEKLSPEYGDWEPYNGYAWYRCVVKVPADWEGYDVHITLNRIDDVDKTYFNGVFIGGKGNVLERREYVIPSSLVKYGKDNILAIQVLDTGGSGGIYGPKERLMIRPEIPWEGIKGKISIRNTEDYIFKPKDNVEIEVTVESPFTDKILPLEYRVEVKDWENKVLFSRDGEVEIFPNKQEKLLITYVPEEVGYYDISVRLMQKGVTAKELYGSFAVFLAPVVVKDAQSSPFGINAGALFHIGVDNMDNIDLKGRKRLAIAKYIGAVWQRNDFWWGVIEPEKNKYDWRLADKAVETYKSFGFNLLVILCYNSAWSKNLSPNSEGEVRNYGDYVYNMVSRYKDYVKYWEVWNEPNISEFWSPEPNVENYTKILKEAYRRAKEADPDCKVIGCVTAGTALEFIEKVLQLGGGDYMDIISVHPYQHETPEDDKGQIALIHNLHDMLRKYNVDVPIWITEVGWVSAESGDAVEQAKKVVKLYVHCLSFPYIKRVYYFNLDDWGAARNEGLEGGHFGLVYVDLMPKPSLVAYHTVARLLSDKKFMKKNFLAGKDVYSYLYRSVDSSSGRAAGGGEDVVVLWKKKGESDIKISQKAIQSDEVVIVDIMGRERKLSGSEKYLIKISETPIFLVGRFAF
jgi:hypothetical protein